MPTEIPQWLSLVRTDGLATTLVIFAMIASIFVIRWLGANVVTPLTAKGIEIATAHVEFLNENTKATQAITSGVGQVLSTQEVHGEKIDDLHDLLIVRRGTVSPTSTPTSTGEPGGVSPRTIATSQQSDAR